MVRGKIKTNRYWCTRYAAVLLRQTLQSFSQSVFSWSHWHAHALLRHKGVVRLQRKANRYFDCNGSFELHLLYLLFLCEFLHLKMGCAFNRNNRRFTWVFRRKEVSILIRWVNFYGSTETSFTCQYHIEPCSEFPRSLQFLSVMNIKLFMTSRKRGFICVKHSLIWLFHISLSRHPKARKAKSMWCYPCEMIAPKTTGANI